MFAPSNRVELEVTAFSTLAGDGAVTSTGNQLSLYRPKFIPQVRVMPFFCGIT